MPVERSGDPVWDAASPLDLQQRTPGRHAVRHVLKRDFPALDE